MGIALFANNIDEKKRAVRRQKRASQIESNKQQAAERETIAQTEREARIRRARVIATAENLGTTGSSGVFGSLGGYATRTDANLGFTRGMALGNIEIGNLNQQAADALRRANTSQTLFNLGLSAAKTGL